MCGNGVMIGMVICLHLLRWGLRATTVCFAAAAGTAMRGTAGSRIATATARRIASTTWVSAWPAVQVEDQRTGDRWLASDGRSRPPRFPVAVGIVGFELAGGAIFFWE